jgi:hypothetical protein
MELELKLELNVAQLKVGERGAKSTQQILPRGGLVFEKTNRLGFCVVLFVGARTTVRLGTFLVCERHFECVCVCGECAKVP